MKFLIVDDDSIARTLLAKHMESYGKIDFAVDGEEAFDLFVKNQEQGTPYNLIFLDIMMPNVDGHSALLKIREWENEKKFAPEDGVKIVMTTALSDPKNILSSFREGCEEYVIKPIQREKLLQVLASFGIIEKGQAE